MQKLTGAVELHLPEFFHIYRARSTFIKARGELAIGEDLTAASNTDFTTFF